MYGYVIFTNIEKYSTLKDDDLNIFFNKIIPVIFEELKVYKDSAIIWNTWGDAIFAIYDKAETAINMALAYREAFNKIDFEKFGIKKLNPRIAGNFGEFELLYDPVSAKPNVHGTLLNLTARIEPVTTPGEIFVTKEFKAMSCSSYKKVDNIRFEDMGEIKLPKNAGTLNLYRLCKREEAPAIPVGIIHSYIDDNIQISDNEKKRKVYEERFKKFEESLKAEVTYEEESEKIEDNLKTEVPTVKKSTKISKSLKKKINLIKTSDYLKNFFSSENPFLAAVVIFILAFLINWLLESEFAKNIFSWSGYYFNFALYSLNTAVQNKFSDPDSIKIPQIINPITPAFMISINPWMWLRGFIISSFIVAQNASRFKVKIKNSKNVIWASILIGVLQLGLYAFPSMSTLSIPFFILLIQVNYINILTLCFVCFIGLSLGVGVADKANKEDSKSGGHNIKYTDKTEW